MKLTYESYGQTVTLTTEHDDVDMEELYGLYRQLSLGAGFHTNTVSAYFDREDEFEETELIN